MYNIVIIGISIKGLAYTLNPIFGASYSVRMRPRKGQSLIGVKLYNVLKIYDIRLFLHVTLLFEIHFSVFVRLLSLLKYELYFHISPYVAEDTFFLWRKREADNEHISVLF